MGRDSRQARRARERREQQSQHRRASASSSPLFQSKYSIFGGLAVIVAAIVIFAGVAVTNSGNSSAAAQSTTTAIAETTPVPGLGIGPAECTFTEMVSAGFYHVHAHLEIVNAGKPVTIPQNLGFAYQHDCLYWVHTHSPSGGILHVEAPYKIRPTLGDFFKIWGVPLSANRVWKYQPQPGQTMKVWVNKRPYQGDPANIILSSHELISIEIGPPFKQPASYTWGNL